MSPTHTGSRRAWRIAGTVVVLTALPYGAYTLADLAARRVERASTAFPASSFTSGSITTLDIRTAGRVDVTAGTGPDVSVRTRTVRGLFRPHTSQRITGDTLELRGGCPPIGAFCDVDFTVVVPRGTSVKVSSAGGSVHVTGTSSTVTASSSGGGVTITDTTGSVRATSSGGGITLIGTAGTVSTDSSGGGIRGEALRATTVTASSSGGGVRLTFAAAPDRVDADSSGGGVRVELPKGATTYAVDASASGGGTNIAVKTDPASKHRVRVRSSGGGVTVTYAPNALR